ncbi:MAG: ABC transporter ATP-binding protein, partial [Candidatus Bathyarchaeota archaeon]
MGELKKASAYQRPFQVELATVLFFVFIIMEIASSLGLSPSVASSFLVSINKILSSVVIFTSLLGIYGLLNDDRTGNYFALCAPISEIISGSFSMIGAYYLKQLGLYLLFQGFIAVILGFSAVVCLRTSLGLKELQSISVSPSTLHSNDYAVEAINVSKSYLFGSSDVAAVNGLSMKVTSGEFLAIMGPSGSGKSTLLNLVGALDRPSSGQILIDGIDISKLDDTNLAKLRNEKIGFVFQSYNLVDRSKVLRNMELPALVMGSSKRERLERIHSLLEMVDLDNKAERKPKTLSGGEQQRIAIARALVNDPRIVLADEPTGNLDSKTGRDIMNFLQKMRLEKGTTLII